VRTAYGTHARLNLKVQSRKKTDELIVAEENTVCGLFFTIEPLEAQSEYERKSNNLKITVLALPSLGSLLSFFIRAISDDNHYAFEGAIECTLEGKDSMSYEDIFTELCDDDDVMSYALDESLATTLYGYDNYTKTIKIRVITRSLARVDIWT
jgi:hypothetical protein